MVATNITRNPTRSSRIVTIIAITVCFGLMAQIIATSQQQFEYNQTFMTVGADVKVTGTNTGVGFQTNLTDLSNNITSITTMAIVSGTLPSSTDQGIRVVGLNVTSLMNTVTLQSDYFYNANPQSVMNDLNDQLNGTLISETLASDLGVTMGNSMEDQYTEGNYTYTESFVIVGYMQVSPG